MGWSKRLIVMVAIAAVALVVWSYLTHRSDGAAAVS